MFLLLNLSYMVVQIIYGYITNSLGLISDAIHMLFDCMALAIGLVAAVMSKWPSDEAFTFGYGRIEILSGFANGVFLMLISVSIFFEAIERLLYPPEMNTQRLLLVSFGGLVVNLFGMFAFNGHHHHHHGGGSCTHSHQSHHEHSHHDHDHHNHSHDHHHHRSQNMQGVFLHVLADTLGSVGVIISTLLIQQFGWTGFDPLASIAIAGLIFASVVPLVRDSMHMLLLRLPDYSQIQVRTALSQVSEQIHGITSLSKVQFWPITDTQIMGIVHVTVDPEQRPAKDEMPLCMVTVREKISQEIHSIIRSNVSGLREVGSASITMGKTEKSSKKDKTKQKGTSKTDKVKSSKVEKRKDKKDKSKKHKDKGKGKKDKKDKDKKDKSRKGKKENKEAEDKPASKDTDQPTASGWNNWAAAEFESDERKQKFLRFMGIKKGADSTETRSNASPFASAISKAGANSINKELEKQFSAGLEQRNQGRRGGLGF
ncbi:putative zinc transporter msc2 [Coemansia brasiliensis]|uniref:Zinc transporter msc2 n=1 Tax=Coemansia brasiliensis TaxID=2650707 RepID=A0A9W8LZ55_9FUNG|nr:putative zinc transporter msc2 [Coemansia brasiliensis]